MSYRLSRLAWIAACAAAVSACHTTQPIRCFSGQPVIIPTTDSSAPSVVADIFLPDGRRVPLTGAALSQTITSTTSGQVTIIANTTDPQGAKDIQIWAGEKNCTFSGGVTSCAGPGLLGAPTASNPDSGSPGASGCTERVTSQNLTVIRNALRDVSYEVTITGYNFGGQRADIATAVIRVQ